MFSELNKQVIDQFMRTEFQVKNRWEFVLMPQAVSINPASNLSSFASVAGTVVTGVAGIAVTKLYLQSVSFPPSVGFEYTRIHEQQFISGVSHPDTVSLRFLEDENGSTIRYLRLWVNDIYAEPDPSSSVELVKGVFKGFGSGNLDNGYVLRENQVGARRIGIMMLDKKSGEGIPTYPRIMLYGLCIKEIAAVTFDHESKDPLAYDVTCSVDRIFIPTTI